MQEPTVRPVEGRQQFKRCIDYQYDRNRSDARWIPPLWLNEIETLTPRKNPFFAHADVELRLAHRGRRIVGRIATIVDHLHNQTHGDNVAMFGFFEADDEDAHALLANVERWARAKGRAPVRGPVTPSLNDTAGLLISGFDTDPMLMMPRNQREYAAFIESAGYEKAKDLYAWIYEMSLDVPPLFQRLAVADVNQALQGTDGRLFPLGVVRLLGRRWIIDQIRHAINQTVERMGAQHSQTYRIYQKALR